MATKDNDPHKPLSLKPGALPVQSKKTEQKNKHSVKPSKRPVIHEEISAIPQPDPNEGQANVAQQLAGKAAGAAIAAMTQSPDLVGSAVTAAIPNPAPNRAPSKRTTQSRVAATAPASAIKTTSLRASAIKPTTAVNVASSKIRQAQGLTKAATTLATTARVALKAMNMQHELQKQVPHAIKAVAKSLSTQGHNPFRHFEKVLKVSPKHIGREPQEMTRSTPSSGRK